MPDDPKREHHELLFQSLVNYWLTAANLEVLGLLDAGYRTVDEIPDRYWQGLRENLARQIEPHVQAIIYGSAVRLAMEIGVTMSPSAQMIDSTRSTKRLAEQFSHSMEQTVRRLVAMQLKKIEDNQDSITTMIILLLSNPDKHIPIAAARDSVTLTTAAITTGEHVAANRINEALRYGQRRGLSIEDIIQQPPATQPPVPPTNYTYTPRPADSVPAVEPVIPPAIDPEPETQQDAVAQPDSTIQTPSATKPTMTLSPFWVTRRDEKVCKTCSPLDGTAVKDWPEQFKSGPPAHPQCRCTLRWDFVTNPPAN